MRRRLLLSLLSAVLAVGVMIPISLPAGAIVNDGNLTVGSNSIDAGTSTSIAATFTLTNPQVGSGNTATVSIAPVPGATGTATLAIASQSGDFDPCSVLSGGLTVECDFNPDSNGSSGTLNLTFTASSDASGQWDVTSEWSRNSPSGGGLLDTDTITVTAATPSADLSVTKSDGPDPVVTGQNLTYTLSYANAGPDTAVDVEVFDNLPGGVALVSATPDQGSCSAGAGVTCDLGDLPSGASGQVTIVVTVNAAAGSVLSNQAFIQAAGGPTDPDASNNSFSVTTDVVAPSADVSISKSDDVDPVLAGGTLTYTLGYANAGPSDASGVTVIDALDSDTSFVSVVSDDGTCGEAGGVVTCDIGLLASGASGDITIVVTVAGDAVPGSLVSNSATIIQDPSFVDPDPLNNVVVEETTVQGSADVSISKSDDVDPVLAGGTLTYTLGYANAGPSDASGVTVIDALDSDTSFVSVVSDDGTCGEAGGVVTCDIGLLASGASGDITIVVTVAGDAVPGSLVSNSATIIQDPSFVDPDPLNNVVVEETTVQGSADLSIGKSDDFEPVPAGGQLTYALGYDNDGPSDATNVQIVDTLPAGVTFVSATPFQGTCSEAAGVITCDVGDVPAADPIRQIAIVVDVDASLADGSTLTNTATISGDQVDSNTDNNTATEDTAVVAVADLSLTKDDALDPVLAGEQIVYTLQYENDGPSDATDVQVVDTLPAGVVFVSAVADDGTCSGGAGVVTCDLGTLAAGSPAGTITIVVDVPADAPAATVTNTATITSDADDTEPDNDTASADTTIEVEADLSITKTGDVDSVAAGGQVVYTLQYENVGPSDAVAVQVVDTLPLGAIFNNAAPEAGSCTEAAGTVTCDIGTLEAGAGGVITVTIDVPGNTPSGTLSNAVVISSDTADPNPGNNTASEATEVVAEADLSISKSASPGSVNAGDDVTYTIAFANAGPSTAVDVVVTDTLPSGVSFVSAAPETGTCDEADGVVTCTLGDVVAGAGGSIHIVATVPTDADEGSITNVADIRSATTDPTPGNNATAVAVEVLAEGASPDNGDLPFTGLDARSLSAIGLALLLGGVLVLGRRRGQQA